MKELRKLNKYFLKYKWHFLGGVLFITLSNFFALIPAQYVRKSLDTIPDLISAHERGGDLGELEQQLLFFGLVIVGAALIRGILMFFMRQTIIVMSRHIEYDLKNAIYAQYQKLDLAFYKQNKIGDLMNRISEDVTKVRMYLGPALMYSINLITLIVIVISNMFRIDPVLSLYALIPLPILSISIYIVADKIDHRSGMVQAYLSKLSSYVQETFSGIRILKAYAIEIDNSQRFHNLANNYKDKYMSLVKVNALFLPIIILLIGVSNILVLYIGGMRAIQGHISTGVIAEFLIYVNMLTWPVTSIGWVTSIVQQAEASQRRINEFLNIKPSIQNSVGSAEMEELGDVEFRNVSFTYSDTGIQALKDVSFTVPKGKTTAIVGKTGSGKSTIAQLITRMYDVGSGEIRISGNNIQALPLYELRKRIGVVPQEAFLFSDTIAHNIAFGVDEVNLEEVQNAARKTAIHESIMEFKDAYDTILGERGVTLSGGQKQRSSMARALIKKPEMLILDDSLSAVDTETEEKILNHLQNELIGKSAIIISHRVSSVKNADEILVLEEGRITEMGSHSSLMQKKGYYYDLYMQQTVKKEASR